MQVKRKKVFASCRPPSPFAPTTVIFFTTPPAPMASSGKKQRRWTRSRKPLGPVTASAIGQLRIPTSTACTTTPNSANSSAYPIAPHRKTSPTCSGETLLLFYSSTLLLFYSSTLLLFYSSTLLLFYSSTLLLFYSSTLL